MDRELSLIKLNFVLFSETRCGTQDVFVEGRHRLIWSNGASASSPASGVAILVKRKWTSGIKKVICLNDRVMSLDLKIFQKTIRLISIYFPHSGYERKYCHYIVTDIDVLVTDAIDKEYQMILGGDFNLNLNPGYRGQVMEELCSAFSLDIANGVSMENDPSMWTMEITRWRISQTGLYF